MTDEERKAWEAEKIGHDLHHATANIAAGLVLIVISLLVAAGQGVGPWAR